MEYCGANVNARVPIHHCFSRIFSFEKRKLTLSERVLYAVTLYLSGLPDTRIRKMISSKNDRQRETAANLEIVARWSTLSTIDQYGVNLKKSILIQKFISRIRILLVDKYHFMAFCFLFKSFRRVLKYSHSCN